MKVNIYKKILETEISKLAPLLSFGNNLNALYSLHELGVKPSIHNMLVPAFISIYGGSLLTNLTQNNFTFTYESILYFITSLIVFNIVHNLVLVKKSLKVCSIVGKGLGYIINKNSKESLPTIIGRSMVSEAFSQTFKKIYFPNSDYEFTPEKFKNFVFNLSILILSKLFQIPDHYLFGTIIFIEMKPIIEKMFFKEERNSGKKNQKNRNSYSRNKNKKTG